MKAIIAIGTNDRQVAHMHWVTQRLNSLLGAVRFSRILWTPDSKGSGRYYMNRLAAADVDVSTTADGLQQVLKNLEAETHRQPGRVTLDLDLLLLGDVRYHLSDWPRPYVQQLINDII